MSDVTYYELPQHICVAILTFIQKRRGGWQEALRELAVEIEAFLHDNAEMINEEESAQAFMRRLEGKVAEFPSESVPKTKSRKNGTRVAETGHKNRGLTLKEAAAHCGYSVSGFKKWIRRTGIDCRINETRRYDASTLNAALDALVGVSTCPSLSALDQWVADNEG